MLRALPHAIGFVLPPAIVLGVAWRGPWLLLPLVVVYVVLPLIDHSLNAQNPRDDSGDLSRNPWFRAITWLWVPTQIAVLTWVLGVAAGGRLTALETVMLTASLGVTTGGIGITFAHELIHRPGRFERALGEVLLGSVCYMHFAIEHVFGHHRYVGTPRDSATARAGESSYAFVVRSVIGGWRSAWSLSAESARSSRGGPALRRRMHWYIAWQAVAIAAVATIGGPRALAVFLGQSVVAFALLELINYIEHYGLARRETVPGRFEPVAPWHSWNSSHRVSNWVLINLARHADHHLTASKRYQVLHTIDAAPQLPAGYPLMILLALVPPLWRRVMDPRVAEWERSLDARPAARSTPVA
jgi:alkane 1-monooxygenase